VAFAVALAGFFCVFLGPVYGLRPAAAEVLLPENAPECLILAAFLGKAPPADCRTRAAFGAIERNPPSHKMTFRGQPGTAVGFPVKFQINSDRLTAGARQYLDIIGRTMQQLPPDYGFSLAGHTDASGPRDFNQELSRRRAESVRRYLSEQGGIGAGRLQSAGFGPDDPIDPGAPYDPNNRRVTFFVHAGTVAR